MSVSLIFECACLRFIGLLIDVVFWQQAWSSELKIHHGISGLS